MPEQALLHTVYLIFSGLLLLSCAAQDLSPTPDIVATQVAVKSAAASTLTAEAPTKPPAPPPATATATPEPISSPTPTASLTPSPSPAATNTATATPTSPPALLPTDTPQPALSGRLLYVSNCDGDYEIYLGYLGPTPSVVKLTDNHGVDDWFPDWAADGTRIVFTSNRTGNYDLYTMNGDGSNAIRFVNTPAWDEYGNWEPGSDRIVFSTTAEINGIHNAELFRRNADGSLSRLTTNQGEDRNPDWHPTGEIYHASNADGNWDIFALSLTSGQIRNLTNHPAIDEDPSLSPDYNRLVFVRKEADTNGDRQVGDGDTGNITLMNTDGSGVQAITTSNLDNSPAWSPDGQWVIYSRATALGSRSSNLYATNISDGRTVRITSEEDCSIWGAAWTQ